MHSGPEYIYIYIYIYIYMELSDQFNAPTDLPLSEKFLYSFKRLGSTKSIEVCMNFI